MLLKKKKNYQTHFGLHGSVLSYLISHVFFYVKLALHVTSQTTMPYVSFHDDVSLIMMMEDNGHPKNAWLTDVLTSQKFFFQHLCDETALLFFFKIHECYHTNIFAMAGKHFKSLRKTKYILVNRPLD